MNGEKPRGLIPPRPNLGPEPWRDPGATDLILLGLVIASMILLVAGWLWRRRRSRGVKGPAVAEGDRAVVDPGPRGRFIGLSGTIRDALTAKFGQSFRARTTEELSTDARLIELLGDEGFRELILFLDRVDRIKFAPEGPAGKEVDLVEQWATWEPLITILIDRIHSGPRRRTSPLDQPRRRTRRSRGVDVPPREGGEGPGSAIPPRPSRTGADDGLPPG